MWRSPIAGSSGTPRFPGVRGIRPGFSFKKLICDLFMARKLLVMLRATRYDLIHAVEESVFLASAAQRLFGIPFVYDMDSALSEQMVEKHGALAPVQNWLSRVENSCGAGESRGAGRMPGPHGKSPAQLPRQTGGLRRGLYVARIGTFRRRETPARLCAAVPALPLCRQSRAVSGGRPAPGEFCRGAGRCSLPPDSPSSAEP